MWSRRDPTACVIRLPPITINISIMSIRRVSINLSIGIIHSFGSVGPHFWLFLQIFSWIYQDNSPIEVSMREIAAFYANQGKSLTTGHVDYVSFYELNSIYFQKQSIIKYIFVSPYLSRRYCICLSSLGIPHIVTPFFQLVILFTMILYIIWK